MWLAIVYSHLVWQFLRIKEVWTVCQDHAANWQPCQPLIQDPVMSHVHVPLVLPGVAIADAMLSHHVNLQSPPCA